jgi:hypothetical protein
VRRHRATGCKPAKAQQKAKAKHGAASKPARNRRGSALSQGIMKTIITLVILFDILVPTRFAVAASKARRDSPQYRHGYSYSDQSSRYPHSNGTPHYGGTYEGRPLSEWLRPGTW